VPAPVARAGGLRRKKRKSIHFSPPPAACESFAG